MRRGILTISTPKWKVREYVRIAIGIVMAVVVITVFTGLALYGEYIRMSLINWLFN